MPFGLTHYTQNKPIIAFLHGNPRSLTVENSEENPKSQKKLEAFREKVKQKMVQFWTTPDELATKITTSLYSLMRTHPAEGWVKFRYAVDTDEVQRLHARVKELEGLLAGTQAKLPEARAELPAVPVSLLQNAGASPNGLITVRRHANGKRFQAGDFVLETTNRREIAKYEAAIERLNEGGFVKEIRLGGFELTNEGYAWLESEGKNGERPGGSQPESAGFVVPDDGVELLKAATQLDSRIRVVRYDGGYKVLAGDRQFVEEGNPHSAACFKELLEKLVIWGFIHLESKDMYALTSQGFEIADKYT